VVAPDAGIQHPHLETGPARRLRSSRGCQARSARRGASGRTAAGTRAARPVREALGNERNQLGCDLRLARALELTPATTPVNRQSVVVLIEGETFAHLVGRDHVE